MIDEKLEGLESRECLCVKRLHNFDPTENRF